MAKVELTDRARTLRATQTNVEGLLWGRLRNRRLHGWKWKRQVPRCSYIVDFFCADAHLVVELDGSQHSDRADYDDRRTAYLESLGLTVLRFWNMEVIENLDGVCETIVAAVPLTLPSPCRGEG